MPEVLPTLAALLPSKESLGNTSSSASASLESSTWTEEETRALSAFIRRHLEHGWHLETSGLLVKGEGKSKAEVRPHPLLASKSGDPDYNPRTDATALRIYPDATFINANRYTIAGVGHVDRNGMFLDDEACPECGSKHGEHRFHVRAQNRNPHAQRWEQAWTYCRRCCTEEEIEELKRPTAPARQGRTK